MDDILYHGRGLQELMNIAEEGVIKGWPVDDPNNFPGPVPEINHQEEEKAVWLTDNRKSAVEYVQEGGYFEVNSSYLKLAQEENSSYVFAIQDEISLDHVERIMVENREGDRTEPSRNLDIELANRLDEEYEQIRIGTYQPEEFSVE